MDADMYRMYCSLLGPTSTRTAYRYSMDKREVVRGILNSRASEVPFLLRPDCCISVESPRYRIQRTLVFQFGTTGLKVVTIRILTDKQTVPAAFTKPKIENLKRVELRKRRAFECNAKM